MPRSHFAHVETWVFDLDNTLYAPEIRLFDLIEARMTGYLVREFGLDATKAAEIRRRYWQSYGATLAGLMAEHGHAPEPYLSEVHDIDLSGVPADPALAQAIKALPGRKIVYTNGSRAHARRVTQARGLGGVFDALYGFEDAGHLPKPRPEAYAAVFALDGLDPSRAAMFEDDLRNLEVPYALGMRTVLVGPAAQAAHPHHHTDNLLDFLIRIAPLSTDPAAR